MSEKKLVPAIRFRGFTDAWGRHELISICNLSVLRNTNNQCKNVLTISAEFGLIPQKQYFGRQLSSADLSQYFLVSEGQFAYNRSSSKGHPYGIVAPLELRNAGVVSPIYTVFSCQKEYSYFLKWHFESCAWFEGVRTVIEVGARSHGLLNIPSMEFLKTRLSAPASAEERSNIASLFSAITSAIALRQRELDKLKELKKSLLERMFPSEE